MMASDHAIRLLRRDHSNAKSQGGEAKAGKPRPGRAACRAQAMDLIQLPAGPERTGSDSRRSGGEVTIDPAALLPGSEGDGLPTSSRHSRAAAGEGQLVARPGLGDNNDRSGTADGNFLVMLAAGWHNLRAHGCPSLKESRAPSEDPRRTGMSRRR